MLRHKFLAALLAITSIAGVANAQMGNCCGGEFRAGAEWLYMRPYVSHLTYARTLNIFAPPPTMESEDFARGELKAICPNYDSGVRVWLGWSDACDCWGVQASYLYFENSAGASTQLSREGLIQNTSERFVLNPLGLYADPGQSTTSPRDYQFLRAVGAAHFEYQNFNFDLYGRICNCCPFELKFFAGFGWAEVNHKLRAKFSDLLVDAAAPDRMVVCNRSSFSGIGPRIGLDAEWQMPCFSCVTLHAYAAHTLLISSTSGELEQTIFDNPTNQPVDLHYREKFPNCDRLIPAIEGKIGLKGAWECGCVGIAAEIGYRVDHYINALNTHRLPSSTIESLNPFGTEERLEVTKAWTSLGDVSFGGLYLGAELTF